MKRFLHWLNFRYGYLIGMLFWIVFLLIFIYIAYRMGGDIGTPGQGATP